MKRRSFLAFGLLLFTPLPAVETRSPEYWRWWRSRRGA